MKERKETSCILPLKNSTCYKIENFVIILFEAYTNLLRRWLCFDLIISTKQSTVPPRNEKKKKKKRKKCSTFSSFLR